MLMMAQAQPYTDLPHQSSLEKNTFLRQSAETEFVFRCMYNMHSVINTSLQRETWSLNRDTYNDCTETETIS